MKVRFLAVVVIAILAVGIWAVAFYNPRLATDPIRPPEHYALDIVFCEEQSEPCVAVTSSPQTSVFAHVVATEGISTTVVQLETDSPVLGTIKHEEFYVRQGETYDQWIELGRAGSCQLLPCTLSLTVYIQYQPVLTESVTFV